MVPMLGQYVYGALLCSSSGNPLSLVDLMPLLRKTLKDESSVTCKMACSAVRVRLDNGLDKCVTTVCTM